jgi:F0F1-type ATP synthase membrane subunit c/vacuolar-type H+-ATPase subunit K
MDPFTPYRRWRQIVATVLTAMLAAPVAAQSPGLPTPGSRIRVRTVDVPYAWVSGTVRAQTAEALWLDEQMLPLESITHLEMSGGRKSHFLTGLGLGTLAGVGLGLAMRASLEDDLRNTDDFYDGLGIAVVGVAALPAGIMIGAMTGGLVGAIWRTERWRAVSTDRLRVAVVPTSRGGLGVGVEVAF